MPLIPTVIKPSYPPGWAICPHEVMTKLSALSLHLVSTYPAHEPLKERACHETLDEGNEKRLDEQSAYEGDSDGTLASANPGEI